MNHARLFVGTCRPHGQNPISDTAPRNLAPTDPNRSRPLLQATALGLGTVVVGAFRDGEVHGVLGLSATAKPLSLMPVGIPPRCSRG